MAPRSTPRLLEQKLFFSRIQTGAKPRITSPGSLAGGGLRGGVPAGHRNTGFEASAPWLVAGSFAALPPPEERPRMSATETATLLNLLQRRTKKTILLYIYYDDSILMGI